jgi:hypothetical protein
MICSRPNATGLRELAHHDKRRASRHAKRSDEQQAVRFLTKAAEDTAMLAGCEETSDGHGMEREHRFRLTDGRIVACLELGDPGGSPILYFHGYPGSRLEGRLAAGAAQRLSLRVLAPHRWRVGCPMARARPEFE